MEPDFLHLIVSQGTNDTELNAWIQLLGEHPDRFGSNLVAEMGRKQMLDGWGQPMNLRLVDQITATNLNSSMLLPGEPIVLWSSGPNKINENGFGDDVWLEPSRIARIRRVVSDMDYSDWIKLKESGGWR